MRGAGERFCQYSGADRAWAGNIEEESDAAF